MTNDTYKKVLLEEDSTEYNNAFQKFFATARGFRITTIERIQNPLLYQSYMLRKQKMDKDSYMRDNERWLFHGTSSASVDAIIRNGFNRSLCGKHGNYTF